MTDTVHVSGNFRWEGGAKFRYFRGPLSVINPLKFLTGVPLVPRLSARCSGHEIENLKSNISGPFRGFHVPPPPQNYRLYDIYMHLQVQAVTHACNSLTCVAMYMCAVALPWLYSQGVNSCRGDSLQCR